MSKIQGASIGLTIQRLERMFPLFGGETYHTVLRFLRDSGHVVIRVEDGTVEGWWDRGKGAKAIPED